ncbi:hypothetical protein TNCV_821421 [Trichonephila clavipes]|nr:hypothetical protein TNCV_821421 [Trichonephila clavipes]
MQTKTLRPSNAFPVHSQSAQGAGCRFVVGVGTSKKYGCSVTVKFGGVDITDEMCSIYDVPQYVTVGHCVYFIIYLILQELMLPLSIIRFFKNETFKIIRGYQNGSCAATVIYEIGSPNP